MRGSPNTNPWREFDNPEDGSIPAGLLLLEAITPYGQTRTAQEIADACGCHVRNIQYIEKTALAKLKTKFAERLNRLSNFDLKRIMEQSELSEPIWALISSHAVLAERVSYNEARRRQLLFERENATDNSAVITTQTVAERFINNQLYRELKEVE